MKAGTSHFPLGGDKSLSSIYINIILLVEFRRYFNIPSKLAFIAKKLSDGSLRATAFICKYKAPRGLHAL